VYVSVGKTVVGVVDVADQIRPDAAGTIAELQSKGVDTIMLSGDRSEAAQAVAAAVGIPAGAVHAGIKPAGKAALVEELKAKGRRVAMVGDGINDTAALAAADVGMAMAEGVDAASDVSKIVLMGGHLHQVADALDLSKKTLAKIHQNLGWAFCYNIVGIPLAAGALLPSMGIALTPSISGALMGVSSLAVMGNSLLLQWEMGKSRSPVGGTALRAAAVVGGSKEQQQQQGGAQQQLVVGSVVRQQQGANKVLRELEGQEAAAVEAGA
jgi:Cu2+-exporting ATPase